jgi:nucleoside-diphosphate-sugar epimerase
MISKPGRVLVTGATGLAGSHTVRALLDAGHEVRAFVRNPDKARRVFEGQEGPLETAQGDISDVTSVRAALRGCDGVIHCAALVAVDLGNTPDALIETNVAGVRNVVGTAVEQGLERIVHVSSLATLFRGDGTEISETSEPQQSKHAYGQSKTIAETYVRELQAKGHPVKIVYPGAIIAPNDPGLTESMNALCAFINDFIPLTTGGMQFIDARDLAVAHVRILEAPPGPARYLAAGTFLRWAEVASLLEAANGKRPRTIRVPAPLLRAIGWSLDLLRHVMHIDLPLTAEAAAYVTKWHPIPNSEAFDAMGVKFRDISESLQDTVDWLRETGRV